MEDLKPNIRTVASTFLAVIESITLLQPETIINFTYNPSPSNTTYSPLSSNTTYNPLSSNTKYNSLSSNTMYTPLSGNTTYNPLSSNTTYNSLSSNTTYNPLSRNTTYNPLSSNTTYNPLSSNTTYNPLSSNTTYNPLSSNTTYDPLSSNTTYTPLPGNTTYNALSSNTTYNPLSSNTTYTPLSSNTTYNQLSSNTTYNALSSNSTYNALLSISMHDDLPSNADSLALTRFVVQKVLVPAVVSLGILGNVLNMVILTRRSMRSSMNCYLTALAVFDTLYLVFSLTLSFKHYAVFSLIPSYIHWFPYGRVLTDMSANVAVLLTVTFTVERYIGVCLPMKGRILCTVQRAKVIIALVISAGVICTVPELFEMSVVEKIKDNTSFPVAEYTKFAMTYGYKMGYYWFVVTVFTFIPLILLCVFNGILIHSVCKAVEVRRRMTSIPPSYTTCRRNVRYTGEQQKITKMLITVVLVFLLCQFPGAILLLYSSYIELADVTITSKMTNNLRIAGNCTNLLVQINASINFLLYSLISMKFRRIFYHVVCKIPRQPRHHEDSKMSDYSAVHTTFTQNKASKVPHNYFLCVEHNY